MISGLTLQKNQYLENSIKCKFYLKTRCAKFDRMYETTNTLTVGQLYGSYKFHYIL